MTEPEWPGWPQTRRADGSWNLLMRSLSAFCEAWRQLGVFATRTQFTPSQEGPSLPLTHSRSRRRLAPSRQNFFSCCCLNLLGVTLVVEAKRGVVAFVG